MATDWSVKIIPDANGVPAAIVPDLRDSKAGDPLQAQEDDLVSWNNTSNKSCQPWPTDWKYNLLPDGDVSQDNNNSLSAPIPAGESSRPSYDVAMPTWLTPTNGNIIYYCLKEYPNVRGTIVVTPVPAALNLSPQ